MGAEGLKAHWWTAHLSSTVDTMRLMDKADLRVRVGVLVWGRSERYGGVRSIWYLIGRR